MGKGIYTFVNGLSSHIIDGIFFTIEDVKNLKNCQNQSSSKKNCNLLVTDDLK